MTRVKAFFDRIIFLAAALAAAQLIFMMLSQSIDVFLRYFFNQPQAWAKEIPEKMLLYITFLATAWVLKEEKHVTMDFITSRLKGRASAILNIVTSVISALVCLLLVWYGATATWLYTAWQLVQMRQSFGRPWALAAAILGAVAILSLMAGLLLNSRVMRVRYIE